MAVVVLPDHLHAIFALSEGNADYSGHGRMIKSGFTQALAAIEDARLLASREKHSLWQKRFWEHTIRGNADFSRHVDYIHANPVKHRHAQSVVDWPFSSIQRYIRQGVLPRDWGGDAEPHDREYGERCNVT